MHTLFLKMHCKRNFLQIFIAIFRKKHKTSSFNPILINMIGDKFTFSIKSDKEQEDGCDDISSPPKLRIPSYIEMQRIKYESVWPWIIAVALSKILPKSSINFMTLIFGTEIFSHQHLQLLVSYPYGRKSSFFPFF